MKLSDLKPGLPIQIIADHPNGYGGRKGKVIAIGTFEGGPKAISVLVDIYEACLLVVEPEGLDPVEPDPLPPGWAEIEV
ncbi:hypothetical protein V3851_24035 [Paenibacillus sp. M1]|uniref:Nitrogen fixation protein NifZ n=1 Tax=Paenibacillus haidiansis TaxID=1574488 RepID=A0ABU7VYM7_9BACL